jgi:uncharacterized protein YggE
MTLALGVVLIIFLIALTISTIVGIQNKIKEGKYIGQDVVAKNTIMVSSTGEVYAKPDLALLTFSVKTEAETVAKAMSENTEDMNAVIALMKAMGVEEKDLKTTNFNIYPRYEYKKEDKEKEIWPPQPEGRRVLVGYEITQSLQVKIRNIEKIGDIIQGATGAGANQVGSLRFTIDNEDELKKQAREEAIQKAKDKAKELAGQLGVDLVRITNFSESGIAPRLYSYDYAMTEAVGLGGGETPQIETGENKIEVTVSVTYEIH